MQPQSSLNPSISIQPQPSLLSIAIPQQNLTPSILSPSIISPLQLQQLQTHLSQVQFITIPGKQSVTVECQTSPINNEPSKFDLLFKRSHEYQPISSQQTLPQQQLQPLQPPPIPPPPQPTMIQQYQQIIETKNPIIKINAYSQTIEPLRKPTLSREVNTEAIDASSLPTKTHLSVHVVPKVSVGVSAVIVKQTRNQTVSVNLYEENAAKNAKSFEEKGVQANAELICPKKKYFLYLCKYSYDPFKDSPNDNPEAELPLLAGDYLYILSEEDEDGFFMGELINGRQGLVPSNFVEKVNLDINGINKLVPILPKSNLKIFKILLENL